MYEQSSDPAPQDWTSIAQGYLDDGDGFQAHMAATEATQRSPGDAHAWYIRAQASLELDHGSDALFEITEAIRLEADNPRFHAVLGDVHCGAEDWTRARQSYQRAQALDPSTPLYAIGIANTYLDTDPDLAIPIYEKAVGDYPDVALFREHLAAGLLESITAGWSEFADGSRSITNETQLAHSRQLLARIARLDLRGEDFTEIRGHIAEIDRLVDRAAQVKWYGSEHAVAYLLGVAGSVLAIVIAFAAGSGAVALLAASGTVAIVTGYIVRHRMPEWKWTQRNVSRTVRRSGLQPLGQ